MCCTVSVGHFALNACCATLTCIHSSTADTPVAAFRPDLLYCKRPACVLLNAAGIEVGRSAAGPVRVMCQDDSTSSCGSIGSLHADAAAMEVASEGSPHDGDVDGSATEEIEDDGGDTARPSLDAVFAAYTPPISREAFPPVDGIRLQRHADGSWQVWFPGAHSPASERWSWAGAHEPERHTHPEAASVPPPNKASKRSGCHRPNSTELQHSTVEVGLQALCGGSCPFQSCILLAFGSQDLTHRPVDCCPR